MMNGRNNGKKLMAIRIVAHAFEIVCQTVPFVAQSAVRLTFFG
jgi:ribosomal protein S7